MTDLCLKGYQTPDNIYDYLLGHFYPKLRPYTMQLQSWALVDLSDSRGSELTTFCSLAQSFNYRATTAMMFNVEMLCVVDQKSKENLSKELSDLVIYCKNVHFNSFEHSRAYSKPYEMSSFSESKARKLIKEAGKLIKCKNK